MYMLRWQASSLILAPCIFLIPNNAIIAAIVSNFFGSLLFFQVDKFIFKHNKNHKSEDK